MVIIISNIVSISNRLAISSEFLKGSSISTDYMIGGVCVINCFEAKNKAQSRGVNREKVFIKMLTILMS